MAGEPASDMVTVTLLPRGPNGGPRGNQVVYADLLFVPTFAPTDTEPSGGLYAVLRNEWSQALKNVLRSGQLRIDSKTVSGFRVANSGIADSYKAFWQRMFPDEEVEVLTSSASGTRRFQVLDELSVLRAAEGNKAARDLSLARLKWCKNLPESASLADTDTSALLASLGDAKCEESSANDPNVIVAGLLSHPTLLKAGGLLIRVEVPAESLRGLRTCSVSVQPASMAGTVKWIFRTSRVRCAAEFEMASLSDDAPDEATQGLADANKKIVQFLGLRDGLVDLGRCNLFEMDALAAGYRGTPSATAATASPPGYGLSVLAPAADELQGYLKAKDVRAKALVASAAVTASNGMAACDERKVYAEDVYAGFEVWVQRGEPDRWLSKWYSLSRRKEKYTIGDTELTVAGRSLVSFSGARLPDESLLTSQTLFRWNNWNLGVPHPLHNSESRLSRRDSASSSESSGSVPKFKCELSLSEEEGLTASDSTCVQGLDGNKGAKGEPTAFLDEPTNAKLPRLRYGKRHRFAAVAVDVGGEPLRCARVAQRDLDKSASVSQAHTFGRLEPVPPPLCVELQKREDSRKTQPNPESSQKKKELSAFGVRGRDGGSAAVLLVPPAVEASAAELHGKLDGLNGSASWRIVSRSGSATPDKGYPDEVVKYLPDPMALGVIIQTRYGTVRADYPGKWPHLKPILLEVTTGKPNEAPSMHDTRSVRSVRVPVASGCHETIKVRSRVDGSLLAHLQPLRWMARYLIASPDVLAPEACRALKLPTNIGAVAGAEMETECTRVMTSLFYGTSEHGIRIDALGETGHDALNPGLELSVANDLSTPAAAPEVLHADASREQSSVEVSVAVTVHLHEPSTGALVANAQWVEPRETELENGAVRLDWRRRRKDAYLHIPVPYPADDTADFKTRVAFRGRATVTHEDTHHKLLTLTPFAVARYPFSSPPSRDSEPGPPVADTVAGATVGLDVMSSAPPTPPCIARIVPIWRWEKSDGGVSRVAGLRVYLAAGWLSTGDGEELAVCLRPQAAKGQDQTTRFAVQYVSRAGLDILSLGSDKDKDRKERQDLDESLIVKNEGQNATFYPLAQEFGAHALIIRFPTRLLAALPAPGDPSGDVNGDADPDVCKTEVGYRICDIPLDMQTAYYPFVKLALARYQPSSLPGCHLSPVIFTDPIQIPPRRQVSVHSDRQGSEAQVTVQVDGPLQDNELRLRILKEVAPSIVASSLPTEEHDAFVLVDGRLYRECGGSLVTGKGSHTTVGCVVPAGCRVLLEESEFYGREGTRRVVWTHQIL